MIIVPLTDGKRIQNAVLQLKGIEEIIPSSTFQMEDENILVNERNLKKSKELYDTYHLFDFITLGIPPKGNHYYVSNSDSRIFLVPYPLTTTDDFLKRLYSVVVTDLRKERENDRETRILSFKSLGIDPEKLHEDIKFWKEKAKMEFQKREKGYTGEDLYHDIEASDTAYLLELIPFIQQFEGAIYTDTNIELKDYEEIQKKLGVFKIKKMDLFLRLGEIAKENTRVYHDLSILSKLLYELPLRLVKITSKEEKVQKEEVTPDNKYIYVKSSEAA